MTLPHLLEPLRLPIASLARLLDYFNDQGVVIGGVAVSLIAEARLTADVDAMIVLSTEDIPQLLEAAKSFDLLPRISDPVQFARMSRMVLLRHKESGFDIDISLGALPFEVEIVERSEVRVIGTLQIRLPTPEDLIIMKAVAHRPKDMLDIQTIITAHPQLDRKRIEFWLKQFAELLETPQVWTDVARLLRKVRK